MPNIVLSEGKALVPLFELQSEQATFFMTHHFSFEGMNDRQTVAFQTWVFVSFLKIK